MTSAADFLPERRTLEDARRAAAGCQGCPLFQHATQTVFGDGPKTARLMRIGEVPGDREDRSGEPFVGPAGRLLDRALGAAGIDRTEVYVTNVVKHFKWEPRGKRRLHRTPNSREIAACLPWLELEIELVHPAGIACLGATAAKALLGPSVRVTRDRGKLLPSPLAPHVTATVHPSALLRLRDPAERDTELERFTADLAALQQVLDRSAAPAER